MGGPPLIVCEHLVGHGSIFEWSVWSKKLVVTSYFGLTNCGAETSLVVVDVVVLWASD